MYMPDFEPQERWEVNRGPLNDDNYDPLFFKSLFATCLRTQKKFRGSNRWLLKETVYLKINFVIRKQNKAHTTCRNWAVSIFLLLFIFYLIQWLRFSSRHYSWGSKSSTSLITIFTIEHVLAVYLILLYLHLLYASVTFLLPNFFLTFIILSLMYFTHTVCLKEVSCDSQNQLL